MADLPVRPDPSDFLIYQTQDGQTRVQVRLADETVWLTQAQMAERRRAMAMADWKQKLDAFLQVNEHEILTHAGRIGHEEAVRKALGEYERFDAARRAFEAENPVSDFDRLVEETRSLEEPEGHGGAGGTDPDPPGNP